MQSFPITTPASASVYSQVAPERSTPLLSEAQLEVAASIKAMQQAAARDPLYNGTAAKVRRP